SRWRSHPRCSTPTDRESHKVVSSGPKTLQFAPGAAATTSGPVVMNGQPARHHKGDIMTGIDSRFSSKDDNRDDHVTSDDAPKPNGVPRRTVVLGAAWSLPVIAA